MSTMNVVFARHKQIIKQRLIETQNDPKLAQTILSYVIDEKQALHRELKRAQKKKSFRVFRKMKASYFLRVDTKFALVRIFRFGHGYKSRKKFENRIQGRKCIF